MRILIAEDEPPTARSLQALVRALVPEATSIETVPDGGEAIARTGVQVPDLVITDIRMPVKTGLDLILHCRGLEPPPLVLVVSGYKDFSYVQEALRYGALDYILKPLDPVQFEACLRRARAQWRICRQPVPERLVLSISTRLQFPFPEVPASPGPLEVLVVAGASLCRDTADSPALGTFPLSTDRLPGSWRILLRVPEGPSPLHFLVFTRAEGPAVPVTPAALDRFAWHQDRPVTVVWLPVPADGTSLAAVLNSGAGLALDVGVFGRATVQVSGSGAGVPGDLVHLGVVDKETEALTQTLRAADGPGLQTVLGRALTQWESQGTTTARLLLALRYFFSRCRLLAGCDPNGGQPIAIDTEARIRDALGVTTSYAALAEALDGLAADFSRDLSFQRDYYHGLVEAVDAYLNRTVSEGVGVQRVATALGLSPGYLSKAFKKASGVALSQHIVQFKIDRARDFMVRYPGALVKHVAQAVGYEDPLYFSRVFQSHTGRPPSEFLHQS